MVTVENNLVENKSYSYLGLANFETSAITEIKEYQIISNTETTYSAKFERTPMYINIKIINSQDTNLSYYKTQLTLQTAIIALGLPEKRFTHLAQIMRYFDYAFNNNQISLRIKTKQDASLILKVPIAYNDSEYSIKLEYVQMEDEEKFNKIIREINTLKNQSSNDEVLQKILDFVNQYKHDKDEDIFELKKEIEINEMRFNEKLKEKENEIEKLREQVRQIKAMVLGGGINRIPTMVNRLSGKSPQRPKGFKYCQTLIKTNDDCGINDIFEVFTSIRDKNAYLVSSNFSTHNLDILNLNSNKLVASLKGHNNRITTIRYFANNNNELLVTADVDKNIIIWNVLNNFSKFFALNTKYDSFISSCIIIFNLYKRNYLITSTQGISKNVEKSSSRMYSLDNGTLFRYINNTNNNSTLYLIPWYNKVNKANYIIELCYGKISINNLLENEPNIELKTSNESRHYGGFIFYKDNTDYLLNTSANGFIFVWNLYNRNMKCAINTNKSCLNHAILWSDKNAIVADWTNKSFLVVDLDDYKIIKSIGGRHTNSVICVKKVFLPNYGECLLTGGADNQIILWSS